MPGLSVSGIYQLGIYQRITTLFSIYDGIYQGGGYVHWPLLSVSPHLVRPSVEERLQDQHRRNLVDDPLPLAPTRVTARVEMPMRLGRRQPLVPQMHGQAELAAQLLRERLRLSRLRTLVARHVQRIAAHRLRRATAFRSARCVVRCSVNSGCAV